MTATRRSRTGLRDDLLLPDRYRIIRRIAIGGMGSVWSAYDSVLGRRVAIKLLGEQFADDPGAIRRFKREARVAAHLSGHPHVVTIFDVGDTDARATGERRPFIVMEHLEGGTVADALAAGETQRDEVMRWLRDAASALDYAHGRGVVHRDIKPHNLILDEARTLHVADFGIARIAREDTITSSAQLFGTAGYISPEQALGRPATEASDRYSLAVVAFELLVGERPFNGEHFAVQARQHVEQRPPRASRRNPSLPGRIDEVLARGMAKQPEERWDSASAFVAALEQALAARQSTLSLARTLPLLAPGERPKWVASRDLRPRALALAALAAVALILGVLVGAGNSDRAAHRGSSSASRAPSRAVATSSAGARANKATKRTAASSAAIGALPANSHPLAGDAVALEARGHQLMLGGSYSSAVGVLRQAVAAAPPTSLTYAYALYDLGRSLRLAGDPAAAVPILRRRLQIPNQTGVVQNELNLALAALGAGPGAGTASNGGAQPQPGPQSPHGHGKPNGHGHGGGGGGD